MFLERTREVQPVRPVKARTQQLLNALDVNGNARVHLHVVGRVVGNKSDCGYFVNFDALESGRDLFLRDNAQKVLLFYCDRAQDGPHCEEALADVLASESLLRDSVLVAPFNDKAITLSEKALFARWFRDGALSVGRVDNLKLGVGPKYKQTGVVFAGLVLGRDLRGPLGILLEVWVM